MDLKRELTDYEIGGIGDIKKHTLRFHSYRIGTMDGKLTIFAEYTPGQFPKVYRSYPSGQELLIELCNLNLELRNKPLEKCARILIRWSLENIHPYYFYGDDVAYLEMNNDDPNGFWDCMVNRLESYRVFVEDMVQDLEQLYTDTMTAFAIRSLMEGKAADAQRIYDGVCVGNKILLSPSRPMPLRSAQNPHNCWVFETIYHSSCVLFDRPLHSKSCIKIVVVCRHIFL